MVSPEAKGPIMAPAIATAGRPATSEIIGKIKADALPLRFLSFASTRWSIVACKRSTN